MFIPLKMVLIGIDPSPQFIIEKTHHWSSHWSRGQNRSSQRALGAEEAHGGSSVSHTWSDFLHGKAGGMPATGNMWLCVCVIYIYIYIYYIYIYIYTCLKWKGGAHTLPTNNLLQTHHWKKNNKTSNMYSPFPLSYSFAILSISNLGMGPKPVPLLPIYIHHQKHSQKKNYSWWPSG